MQTNSTHNRSPVQLILILGALTALNPFSIDMYLPAFPLIARDFGVSVTEVAMSLSSYFVGIALGQLFYGPLLDRFGRKNPLYVGLCIFLLGCLGCLLSTSIEFLIFFRFVQAIGGCAAQVASLAMVRDFFDAKESAKILSLLILILGASPLLAPTTGSYLAEVWGWKSVFGALGVIATGLIGVVYFFLPEGHSPNPAISLRPTPILKNYFLILTNRQFATYTFAGAAAFSGLFVYLASSPTIFLEIFKVSPHTYGWIFAIIAAGLIAFSQLNILLMKKFSSPEILRASLIVIAVLGLIFAVGSFNHWYGLIGTVIILFMYLSCAGLVNPNAASLALRPFSENAGSAAALMGALQMTIGALSSMSVGLLPSQDLFPISLIFLVTGTIGLSIIVFSKAHHQSPTFP